MRRRPFLAAAGTGLALSGCLSRDDAAEPGTTQPVRSDDPAAATSPSGTTDATTDEPTSTTGNALLEDVTARSFAYALRLNDLGRVPRGGATDLADLGDDEQQVVTAAIDGSYETESVPPWLAQFADDTRYVATDDRVYVLEFSLPTYTVTASETTAEAVDGEIADSETYREAVTHDGVVLSGLLRIAARDGVQFYALWDDLESLATDYAAVEYHGEVYTLDLQVDDPGAPYSVEAQAADPAELVDGTVTKAAVHPAAVREHLVAAGERQGVYAFDDAPDGLLDAVREHDYVYHNGTFYAAYVEKDDPVPVEVFANAVASEDGDSGSPRLRIGVRNTGSELVSVMSGAPRPLGVLTYAPVDDASADDGGTLWTDAYEESDHVHVQDGEVGAVNAIGLVTEYAPGEERTDTYGVRGDPSPGTYRVRGSLGVDSSGETLPYEVRFTVTADDGE
jgi:hypothetical protein